MDKNSIHIAFTLTKNHLRILRNWAFFEDNKIAISLAVILSFFIVFSYSFYFGNQQSFQSQVGSVFLTLLIPMLVSKNYFSAILKEESLLLVLFNKEDLFLPKQLSVLFFAYLTFFILLSLGIVPHFSKISTSFLIISDILIIALFCRLLPILFFKTSINFKSSKSSSFWNMSFSNQDILPIGAILIRELLSSWRQNKKYIVKIIFNAVFTNLVLFLFMANNNKFDFLNLVVVLQSILFLTFVANYSTENNKTLLNTSFGKWSDILKGEFVFWSGLFLIYITIISLIFIIVTPQLVVSPIIIAFLTFTILLPYVLFIKISYVDDVFNRNLIFIFSFLVITIPFYIYSGYRRINA